MRTKRAFYNVLTNIFLQIASIIYGFIVPKIIIDNFGSDVNGLVTSITQFLSYITLLESGFGPVVKAALYKPIAMRDRISISEILKSSERFFRRIAFVFVLYILVLCFVFPLIVKSDFDALFTVSLVIVIGMSTFAEYYFGITYRLFLRAEQKSYIISIIQTISYIMIVLAVVLLVLCGADILIIELVAAVLFMVRPLLQNLYVKKKYKLYFNEVRGYHKLSQKWDGLAQHIASVVHNNTDVAVLTFFTSLAEVSVYSVYHLVVFGVRRIVQSFSLGVDASFGDMMAKKEEANLSKKYSIYEMLFLVVISIIFTCSFVLITPFVHLYTNGVTDADYYRPVFGYLLVISEYLWAIREPYNLLVLAAGHFRQTRRGAWVEAIVNIVLSVILVFNFGLIGVAIGTIVAMLIRTVEFVYHANKHILKRSVWESVKKILLAVLSTAFVAILMSHANLDASSGFIGWIVSAIVVFVVASVVTILLFSILYKKELKAVLKRVKRMLRKKR